MKKFYNLGAWSLNSHFGIAWPKYCFLYTDFFFNFADLSCVVFVL